MNEDGYIQVGIDNRGTPALKGAQWRKSIYHKIGDINIRDMAMGAKNTGKTLYGYQQGCRVGMEWRRLIYATPDVQVS